VGQGGVEVRTSGHGLGRASTGAGPQQLDEAAAEVAVDAGGEAADFGG
jgi:hypothetical protein